MLSASYHQLSRVLENFKEIIHTSNVLHKYDVISIDSNDILESELELFLLHFIIKLVNISVPGSVPVVEHLDGLISERKY